MYMYMYKASTVMSGCTPGRRSTFTAIKQYEFKGSRKAHISSTSLTISYYASKVSNIIHVMCEQCDDYGRHDINNKQSLY